MFTSDWLFSLGSVIVIDLILSGDNAIVIGLAAAGLPAAQRKKAIFYGIVVATALRIALSLVTFQLLQIIGLLLAGGLLLLWVCWKMWRELRVQAAEKTAFLVGANNGAAMTTAVVAPAKTMRQALIAIVVADVSMALDNVLAVAGAAKHHWEVLLFGLLLSIALMGVAANYVARILERHYWLTYIGLAIILYVALDMIWRGSSEVVQAAAAWH